MNAPVIYRADYASRAVADNWFGELWHGLGWVRREGVPRREYWTNTFNRDYTYGRKRGIRTYEAQPNHPVIDAVRCDLRELLGVWFEGCFLNGYENSSDALGWHADDDPNIDHSRPIAIVTLYEDPTARPRVIQFKEVLKPGSETEKAVFGSVEELVLGHGSLALMAPGMQSTHQHKIPKAGFVSSPRISLTFRGLRFSPTIDNEAG